jgi:hypothetical protein
VTVRKLGAGRSGGEVLDEKTGPQDRSLNTIEYTSEFRLLVTVR